MARFIKYTCGLVLLSALLSGCSNNYKKMNSFFEPCRDYSDHDILKRIALVESSKDKYHYYYFGKNNIYLLNIKAEDILSTKFSDEGFFGEGTKKLLNFIRADFPLERNEDLQKYVISSSGSVSTLDVDIVVARLLEKGKVRIWSNINDTYIQGYDVVDSSKLIGREFCVGRGLPILFVVDGIE